MTQEIKTFLKLKKIIAVSFLVFIFFQFFLKTANAQNNIQGEKETEKINFLLEELENKLKAVQREVSALSAFISNCSLVYFDRDLYVGVSGPDVKCLQTILNTYFCNTRVADNKEGSLGQETEYFGLKTKEAVVKLQNIYKENILLPLGLSEGTGYVGSRTRKTLNLILKSFTKKTIESLKYINQDIDKIKKDISEIIKNEKDISSSLSPEKISMLPSIPPPIPQNSETTVRRRDFQPPTERNDCGQAPNGEQVYSVSTKNNPRFTEVIINPANIESGTMQNVRVKIYDSEGNPILQVRGEGILDNTTTSFSLNLIGGSQTNGIWEGAWTVPEKFCLTYQLSLTATSASGESNVTITLLTFP